MLSFLTFRIGKSNILLIMHLFYFALQPYPVILMHLPAHLFDQIPEILSCRIPFVDQETSMFFGHCRVVDAETAQPALIDQSRCKVTFRTLERASRAIGFHRLFAPPFLCQLIDPCLHFVRILRLEFVVGVHNDPEMIRKIRMSVCSLLLYTSTPFSSIYSTPIRTSFVSPS